MFKDSATFWTEHPWPTCVMFKTGQVLNNILNYCTIKDKTMFPVWRIIYSEISCLCVFFFSFFVSSLIQTWLKIASLLESARLTVWNTFVHHVEVFLAPTLWRLSLLLIGLWVFLPACLPLWPGSPSFPYAFTRACILKRLRLRVITTISLHLPQCTCKMCMSSQFWVDKTLLYQE